MDLLVSGGILARDIFSTRFYLNFGYYLKKKYLQHAIGSICLDQNKSNENFQWEDKRLNPL